MTDYPKTTGLQEERDCILKNEGNKKWSHLPYRKQCFKQRQKPRRLKESRSDIEFLTAVLKDYFELDVSQTNCFDNFASRCVTDNERSINNKMDLLFGLTQTSAEENLNMKVDTYSGETTVTIGKYDYTIDTFAPMIDGGEMPYIRDIRFDDQYEEECRNGSECNDQIKLEKPDISQDILDQMDEYLRPTFPLQEIEQTYVTAACEKECNSNLLNANSIHTFTQKRKRRNCAVQQRVEDECLNVRKWSPVLEMSSKCENNPLIKENCYKYTSQSVEMYRSNYQYKNQVANFEQVFQPKDTHLSLEQIFDEKYQTSHLDLLMSTQPVDTRIFNNSDAMDFNLTDNRDVDKTPLCTLSSQSAQIFPTTLSSNLLTSPSKNLGSQQSLDMNVQIGTTCFSESLSLTLSTSRQLLQQGNQQTQQSSENDSLLPTNLEQARHDGKNSQIKKKLKRGCRLWEFIRNLLLDVATNPSLIKWENRDEGTFRIVRSKAIARMWGMKKGNEEMNYEKLSRAMRYYYKKQIFCPVIGQRLVYKFGCRATGWQEDSLPSC